MSRKQLINREINARKERLRAVVLTEMRLKNLDTVGANFPVWVCDVDLGLNRVIQNVVVKINGPDARTYARPGLPVFLEKDAQGRYQIVGPADRARNQANLIEINLDTGVAAPTGNQGFTATREVFDFYKGIQPESFFDPGADPATLVWWRFYDRLGGAPENVTPVTDVDGAEIVAVADKSGNGHNLAAGPLGNNPFYRKFDATGGNVNLRSSGDGDGLNDMLQSALNISETTGGEISIFLMLNKDNVGAGDDTVLQTADWRIHSRRGAGNTWGFDQGGGITDTGGTIGTSFTLIELVAAGFGTVNAYQDGVLLGSFSPGGAGLGNVSSHLFNNNASSLAHDGRVVEGLLLDETVTSTKRVNIEAYFNQTMFVNFALWGDGVNGFPKITVRDAQGNEVSL